MAEIIELCDLAAELDELESRDVETNLRGDDFDRMKELQTLQNECGDEWHHGILIPVADFEDYARELADDIGAIPDDVSWPLTCIDWEMAARELAYDYTELSFDGTSYMVRSC